MATVIANVPQPHRAFARIMRARLKRHLARCIDAATGIVTWDENHSRAAECVTICEAFCREENLGPDFLEACGAVDARLALRLDRPKRRIGTRRTPF